MNYTGWGELGNCRKRVGVEDSQNFGEAPLPNHIYSTSTAQGKTLSLVNYCLRYNFCFKRDANK